MSGVRRIMAASARKEWRGTLERTLVVWRRLGKEHGEGLGHQVNPPDVVSRHVADKVARACNQPDDDWRWWQISDDLIVERPLPGIGYSPETAIYYLPRRKWAIIENMCLPRLGPDWPWYVHVGRTCWDDDHGCWVFTDLFCDVIVQADRRTHTVLDLDELANAFRLGLVSAAGMADVLDSTQELVDMIYAGECPPAELSRRDEWMVELTRDARCTDGRP